MVHYLFIIYIYIFFIYIYIYIYIYMYIYIYIYMLPCMAKANITDEAKITEFNKVAILKFKIEG